MIRLQLATLALARAADGNPVISTATIMLFSLMFNLLAGCVETLIWGERFVHWLDPLFLLFWIGYSAYAVWMCAVHNASKPGGEAHNLKVTGAAPEQGETK